MIPCVYEKLVLIERSAANFLLSRLVDDGEEIRKKHDLALEKLQKARDQWNKDRMKRLGFINKRLRQKNEARAYVNNVDDAVLEYYRVFARQIQKRHDLALKKLQTVRDKWNK